MATVHERISRQQAIAVNPGQRHSVHLMTLPRLAPGPNQAEVRVLRVGLCGTDKEIIEGKFGAPPTGDDELVLGHEVVGTIEAIGSHVTDLDPGDHVVAMVRRPDGCPACQSGQLDMCIWRQYSERGILYAHGFMVEQFVEQTEFLVRVPAILEPIAVLVEPLSVVEKAWRQARLIQRRIRSWEPQSALIFGAGPIGLLGAMLLRAHGIAVTVVARAPAPNAAATIVAATGSQYLATRETSLTELVATFPPADLIFEATGVSAIAFAAMELIRSNGVLVLLSLTGGDTIAPVPTDLINRELVLGNKVVVGSVNAAREDFESAVVDLGRFEQFWPGLSGSLITDRLEAFADVHRISDFHDFGIKAVIEFPT